MGEINNDLITLLYLLSIFNYLKHEKKNPTPNLFQVFEKHQEKIN